MRQAILRAALILSVFSLWAAAPPRAQMQAGAGILFSSDRDGNYEIYMMDANGGSVRRLTNDPAIDAEPAWSPDQQRIAFSSNRARNYGIYVMNADGGGLRRLTPDDGNAYSSPTWSPDSQYLAFTSDRAGTLAIYRVSANGGELVALSSGQGEDRDPAWAADGRIVFSSTRDGAEGIYIMDGSGRNVRRLVPPIGTTDTFPAWSPSSQTIAYVADAGFSSELYTVQADGSNATLLTGVYDKFIQSPAWSADGRSLVYALWEPGSKSVIIQVSLDGSSTVQLTSPDSNAREPAWAPPRAAGPVDYGGQPGNSGSGASSVQCPGAPASRLVAGARAQVTPGESNNVRSAPSLSGRKIGNGIPGRGIFMVIEGPACADGLAWWKVNYQGLIGWTAEGVPGDYWLEPLTDSPPPPTDSGSGELCGNIPRRFRVGEVVVVSWRGNGLRILTRVPGGARQALAQGAPYNKLRIDGGPVCESLGSTYGEDSWYYYIYSFTDGVSGWVADGPSWERWLCPLSDQECDR